MNEYNHDAVSAQCRILTTKRWPVRCQKRTAAVRRVRSQYGNGGPPPPDAEGRGLNKRAWEKLSQEWNFEVRQISEKSAHLIHIYIFYKNIT